MAIQKNTTRPDKGKTEYKSYAEKLRDPRWQQCRLRIMERDKFACQQCDDSESTLNVHHRFYRKGANPWDYEDTALVTLCEQCHKVTENRKSWIEMAISGPSETQNSFYTLACAFAECGSLADPEFMEAVTELAGFFKSCESVYCAETKEYERNARGAVTMAFAETVNRLAVIRRKVLAYEEGPSE